MPLARRYLNFALHDSAVLSFRKTARDVFIEINDFQSHCFCEAFAAVIGKTVRHEDVICPLVLHFAFVRQSTVCHVKRNGKLLPISTKRYTPFIGEFLADHLSRLTPESIHIGMLFWMNRKVKRTHSIILELEAERLHFHEHQRATFVRLFGNEHAKCFDLHMHARQMKEQSFDYTSAIKFIRDNSFKLE